MPQELRRRQAGTIKPQSIAPSHSNRVAAGTKHTCLHNLMSMLALEQGGNQQAESQLAKAAVADWLDCLGEYECQPPIGHNEALGAVVAELDALARPKVAPSDLPQIQHLPLKICIVGTPFGGACYAYWFWVEVAVVVGFALARSEEL
eukprot:1152579-Pelagomonas_calceolata.AAC.12